MTVDYMRKLELDNAVLEATNGRLEFECNNLRAEAEGYKIALGQINNLAKRGEPITVCGQTYIACPTDMHALIAEVLQVVKGLPDGIEATANATFGHETRENILVSAAIMVAEIAARDREAAAKGGA